MNKKELPQGYVPSVKDAEWFINNWKNEGKFSTPVNIMFRLCQETYPNNNNLEEVLLKCAAINAFSSTNVYDIYSMAEHIVRKQIDEKLKNNDLSLVETISKINIGGKQHNFYSFATKYCHYHNPDNYAIYDRYVAKVICSFPKEFRVIKENKLKEDYEYFINVLKDFRSHFGLNLSLVDLDKYLWRLGRWYLNPYEPTYIYYHREDNNPFPNEDIRNKFWDGEKMFFSDHQNVSYWKLEGEKWLKTANEPIKQLASKYSPEQFGLITYIFCYLGKWFPYDDPSLILEY